MALHSTVSGTVVEKKFHIPCDVTCQHVYVAVEVVSGDELSRPFYSYMDKDSCMIRVFDNNMKQFSHVH